MTSECAACCRHLVKLRARAAQNQRKIGRRASRQINIAAGRRYAVLPQIVSAHRLQAPERQVASERTSVVAC